MEPNKNKIPKEMPNNFNTTTKKKEGGLSNSSESKGDANSSSKNLLKDLAKKFNSPNEENTIKDPKKLKNSNPSTAKEKTFYQFISGILSDDKITNNTLFIVKKTDSRLFCVFLSVSSLIIWLLIFRVHCLIL